MNSYAVFQKRGPGRAGDDADGVAAKGLLQTLDLVGTPEPPDHDGSYGPLVAPIRETSTTREGSRSWVDSQDTA